MSAVWVVHLPLSQTTVIWAASIESLGVMMVMVVHQQGMERLVTPLEKPDEPHHTNPTFHPRTFSWES